MRIAILQPTFLPWLGWFDIADQVDLLVLLDDVAFSKQSWQQRNRLRTSAGLEYATVPVRTAGRLGQPILAVEIADLAFATRLERMIVSHYARTDYFETLFPRFREVLNAAMLRGRLAELNTNLIRWQCETLGLQTPQRTSSSLEVSGKRGEYVAKLCEALDANEYLSPAGAEEYLLADREAFDRRAVNVWLHEYRHPEYRQAYSPFVPYASTLDLLFNEGPRALEIIRSGRCPPRPLGVTAIEAVETKNGIE